MQNPPLDPSNNPGSSTLEQRLQRRLVEPIGVINTQQLHCHYQATQGMAGRLIQRVALSEQVKFRYGSGVLQPTAMLQNIQRQRRESANDFEGQYGDHAWSGYPIAPQYHLPASPVSGTRSNNLQQAITQKATVMTEPLGERKTSSPLGKTSREIGEPASRGGTYQRLRIDRQATISEVNALSSNKSHSVQRQVETHLNSNPTVTQTQLKTSGALPPPSTERSGILRISRKARIAAVYDKNPSMGNEGESKSPKSQVLPLAQTANQLSASTAQTKVVNDQSLGTELGSKNQLKTHSSVIKGIIQNKAIETKPQSTFSTKSIKAVTPHSQSLALQEQQANLPVQLSPGTAIAINPAVVSPKPSQLSNSSELPRVWLQNIGHLPTSEELSTPTSYSQKMPLPLAKAPISIHRAIAKQLPEGQIARQTNAVDNSTVQLAMPGNSLTQMSSPETASASPIDISKVAEQVSRMLIRQLTVEKERRGIGS